MSKRTAPGASAAALLRGKPCLKQPAPASEPLLRRSSESNSPWGGQPPGLLGERLPLQLQLRRRWHPWGPGAVPRQVQALLAQPAPRSQGNPLPRYNHCWGGRPWSPQNNPPQRGRSGGKRKWVRGWRAGAASLGAFGCEAKLPQKIFVWPEVSRKIFVWLPKIMLSSPRKSLCDRST